MDILTFPVGELRANCYYVILNSSVLIIDPGDEASFLLEEIQRRNLKPVGILATHGHFDHIMAAGEIQASFNIPFYIHPKDLFLIKRVHETAKHFLGYDSILLPINNVKNISAKNFQFPIPNFQIIETPGHTPGSVSIYLPDEQAVFTGDTLFKDGIGSYNHAYSNKKDLFGSINKILKFPEETIIYPGHGDETTVLHARF